MNTADFPAFRIRQHAGEVRGSVERCTLDELPPGEVLIKAEWSSVNYKDALAATGAAEMISNFPVIGGIDVAGTVEHCSSPDFSPGQAVLVTGYTLGIEHDGGYAGFVRVPSAWVVPLPAGMDCRTAMLLGTAGFTVALCLRRLHDNGQSSANGPMVVSGASGGVGMIAIAILSHLGYEVHAVSGKEDMHAVLKQLGASEVLSPESICADHRPLQQGVWGGGIDNVGGDVLAAMLAATRPWGNVVSVGLAASSDIRTTVMPFILRGVSLLGASSPICPPSWRAGLWQELQQNMPPWLPDKLPSQEVSLQQLPQVFAEMLQRRSSGRTIVRIEG